MELWIALLGACAVQFGTTLTSSLELHFYLASALLMGTLMAVLLAILGTDWNLGAQADPPAAPEAS